MRTTTQAEPRRIAIVTLGCSKNVVDSEQLSGLLRRNAFELEADPAAADVIIVNTCGFIDAAKAESVETILAAVALKEQGTVKRVLVAGCLTERYRADLESSIPEVDGFYGVTDFENILRSLTPNYKFDLLGERVLSTPSHFAYMKISEGCDRPCAFCAIPLMRGKHVSRPVEEIVAEARGLVAQGVREIVVVAQDSTYYGLDLYGERRLATLLDALADIEGLRWIRLMYAFPAGFPTDVLDVIARRENICTYLDMPVQHASDVVLESMRRGITRARTMDLINTVRERVPGITLRTSIIVGFPTETDAAFEELVAFVEEAKFDRLGVFLYSQEENTTAHPLGDPIPQDIKELRRDRIMEVQQAISAASNAARIGGEEWVVIDEVDGDTAIGRSERDAPEIDNTVMISPAGALRPGSWLRVRITDATEYDVMGVPVG